MWRRDVPLEVQSLEKWRRNLSFHQIKSACDYTVNIKQILCNWDEAAEVYICCIQYPGGKSWQQSLWENWVRWAWSSAWSGRNSGTAHGEGGGVPWAMRADQTQRRQDLWMFGAFCSRYKAATLTMRSSSTKSLPSCEKNPNSFSKFSQIK